MYQKVAIAIAVSDWVVIDDHIDFRPNNINN